MRQTGLILKPGRGASDAIIIESEEKRSTPTQHHRCSVTVELNGCLKGIQRVSLLEHIMDDGIGPTKATQRTDTLHSQATDACTLCFKLQAGALTDR